MAESGLAGDWRSNDEYHFTRAQVGLEVQLDIATYPWVGDVASAVWKEYFFPPPGDTYFDTITGTGASVSALSDMQTFVDGIISAAAASSSIADVQQFADSYNTTILSLSSVEDRQAFADVVQSLATSGTSAADMQAYMETVQSVAASGASVSDALQMIFQGSMLYGARVPYRSTAPQVGLRAFGSTVAYRSFTAAVRRLL